MSFNEELAIEIGRGILGWHKRERISGKYSSVSLFNSLDVNDLSRVIFGRLQGFYTLASITTEVRNSRYASMKMVGRKLRKQRPGLKTILGEGKLHYPDQCSVGVEPRIIVEGKEWLDIDSLLSLQDQTVILFLIPSLLA